MAKIDLSKYGIKGVTEILYNPTYEVLYNEETKPGLEGYDKGQVTELGAINVMTGVYTGRSPKDKYIVMDKNSKDTVWWNTPDYPNDNHEMSEKVWKEVKSLAIKQLSGKRLFVVDGFCGTHKDTRMKVRFIMEVAWQAHFVTNMFIRPKNQAEFDQDPDFVVYCASKAKVDNYAELGLRSDTCVAFNVSSKEQVILNTWYGGEMKKGMFSMMNYYLPLKGIAAMHCSANTDMNGENTAIFFGLSGTGKTTLSTDPKRLLIGDDEHGWDDEGVFNFEGGCYAKVIKLDKESEPDIYNAIRRDALLENVTVDAEGKIDFNDKSVTENTRVSYPIYHIEKIVRPDSHGPAAKQVIFLSADAFGVLPPVSILTPEQTKYYFLSGFTAKLAGTERGIPGAAPDEVRRGARQAHGEERRQGLSREHGLERHRQAYLHQGHARNHRRHPGRQHRQGPDQEHPLLQLRGSHRAQGCRHRHPRPARHLRRRQRLGGEGKGSRRPLHQELCQV